MTAADVDLMLKEGNPDWERIEFEVCCARCGYNLRMLSVPRCPECGLEFEWELALRQAESESDFLFEHQWRKRPVGSFLVTVWRSFRPIRFWRSVSIHERIAVWPLVFMFLAAIIVTSILTPLLALLIGLCVKPFVPRVPPGGWTNVNFPTGAIFWMELEDALETLAALPITQPRLFARIPGMAGFVLMAALAVVCSLRQTLGRCRVRTVQLLRVLAYSAVPVCTVWALTLVAFVFVESLLSRLTLAGSVAPYYVPLLILGVPALPLGLYVGFGLRDYLRLPRPVSIGIVSAVIAVLAFAVFAVLVRF